MYGVVCVCDTLEIYLQARRTNEKKTVNQRLLRRNPKYNVLCTSFYSGHSSGRTLLYYMLKCLQIHKAHQHLPDTDNTHSADISINVRIRNVSPPQTYSSIPAVFPHKRNTSQNININSTSVFREKSRNSPLYKNTLLAK